MDLRPLFTTRFTRAWRLLLALMMGVVAWFALMPGSPFGGVPNFDKLQHVLAFFTLATVASLAWPPRAWQEGRVAFGLLMYGLLIELVQTQLPTRTASAADVLADAVGIALGLLLARQLLRWARSSQRST